MQTDKSLGCAGTQQLQLRYVSLVVAFVMFLQEHWSCSMVRFYLVTLVPFFVQLQTSFHTALVTLTVPFKVVTFMVTLAQMHVSLSLQVALTVAFGVEPPCCVWLAETQQLQER